MNKNDNMSFEQTYIDEAIQEAKLAYKKEEVPVGAIIVDADGEIIARAHNTKEEKNNPLMHAEILCIDRAVKKLGRWRLNGCSMYVTLEPCPMCAGAIVQSRISNLYIGTFDPKSGGCGSVINITQNDNLNHWVNVKWLYDRECSEILTDFFKRKRKK